MVAVLLKEKWYRVPSEKVVAVCDAAKFTVYPLPDYKGRVIIYQGQLARVDGEPAKKLLILRENDALLALFADQVESHMPQESLEPYRCQ